MTKYHIGDKVRIKKDADTSACGINHAGQTGKITTLSGNVATLDIEDKQRECGIWLHELEPVTKSLDELEVGDKVKVINEIAVIKDVRKTKKYLIEYLSDGSGGWHSVDYLESANFIPYTPKKIKVFKHKGKSYPVKEIVKKVKAL